MQAVYFMNYPKGIGERDGEREREGREGWE